MSCRVYRFKSKASRFTINRLVSQDIIKNITQISEMKFRPLLSIQSAACLYLYLGALTALTGGQQVPLPNAYGPNSYNSLNKQVVLEHPANFLAQNVTTSNRPVDRASLSLVQAARGGSTNESFSLHKPETPEAWLMMEGDDMLTNEARNVAAMADSRSEFGAKNFTTKRSGHKRKGSGKSKSSATSHSNKTQYDDEQSDSSESNEIYDDVEDGLGPAGNIKEPECAAHGRYYCTYKEDYPLKLVTEVTKYYKWPLEKLFRDLHAQIMPKLAHDSTGNLVCDSITRVVRPGWARSTNDRWLVVINTENYHQYVTEVVCQYGTNSRCNFIPPCYYSSCQQRYNTQKLLVIDPQNPYRGPFLSEFLFPSCCVCYVPTASESFQDKYRSSPATIYQRTMQQEANNNLNPPKFRPVEMIEEVGSSSLLDHQQTLAGAKGASPRSDKHLPSIQTPEPGEIRRSGDLYKSSQKESSARGDLIDFPRLSSLDSVSSSSVHRKSEARPGCGSIAGGCS